MIKNIFMSLFLIICFLSLISCEEEKNNDVLHEVIEQDLVSLQPDVNVEQEIELNSDVHITTEHYAPESENMPYAVRVSANHHLDAASVEDAIFSSLQYNRVTDISNRLKLEIEWEDPSQFYVYFHGLQLNESVHFSLAEAVTEHGVKLSEADQPTYLHTSITVTLPAADLTNIQLTKLPDFETESLSLPRIIDYRMVNISDEERRFMAYASDRSHYTLVHPQNLKYEQIPQLTSVPDYSSEVDLQSYFQEMAADRWEKEKFYVVLGTKDLYYYDYKKKAGQKIFETEKSIYNLSISPDYNQIALLVSQEEMAHPHAELIIVDTAGKVIFQEESAAVIPHSDGIWSFYPIEWLDRDTVRVQSEIEIAGEQNRSFGYKDFQISSGELSVAKIPTAKWNEDATELHLSETDEWIAIDSKWRSLLQPFYEDTELRYYPSPDNTYAILAYMQHLFVYDHHAKSMDWIGEGSFVEWTEDHSFLWLQGYDPFMFF